MCSIVILVNAVPVVCGLAPERREFVTRVVDHIVRCEYDQALRITDSLTALGDPAFMMLRLNVLGIREMDFELMIDSAAVGATYRRTMLTLDSIEQYEGESAYTVMLRGFTMAAMASYDLRRKAYGSAVRVGVDALRLLQRAAASDSTVADPDYFLGLYDWSRSELRRRLWWVLFWLPGDRAQGIRRLERCRRSSLFASTAATLALVDIYVEEKRFADAEALLRELEERYSGSRFVLWSAARRCVAIQDYSGAAAAYGRLADSYEKESYGSGNAVTCRVLQTEWLYRAGKLREAEEAYKRVVQLCEKCPVPTCEEAYKWQRRFRNRD